MSWLLRSAIAEFIGTFALIFIGAGSIVAAGIAGAAGGLVGVALAHGLTIAVMVSALGHVSGGHFNPAVTFGFLVTGRLSPATCLVYWIAQLLGGVAGGLALLGTFPPDAITAAGAGVPVLNGVNVVAGIAIEALLTFFLVTAVFGTAVDPRGPKVGGFGIGLTIALDILAGGPLTGASMNPARTFGPALAFNVWNDHLVYWIGPLIGGALAALIYHHVLMPSPKEVAALQ
ncbi:MAG TPA: MIP family channel protein [Chloroflexota bacterium]